MMPGCHICRTASLCAEGRRLWEAVDALCTDWQRCPQGTIRRAQLHAAEAAYLEHRNGSWDDDPGSLTDLEMRLLGCVRLIHAEEIAEWMHRS